jgi:Tfp pilus assembly protein PilE
VKIDGNNRGLSLIELMVTSTIAMIMGLIVFSVFLMYNNTSRVSISFFLMQQQYENIAHQIARDVRRASHVLKVAETPRVHGTGYDTVCSIMVWENSGPFTQYTIKSGQLYEGTEEILYEAGGGTVKLNIEGSYFILDPQRKKLKLHLSLRKAERNTTYALSPREDLIVCRN